MSNKVFHLVSTLRGTMMLLSLNINLKHNEPTPQVFPESQLMANAEIMAFKAKGALQFLDEGAYNRWMEFSAPKPVTVEDALEENSPESESVKELLSNIESSFKKLKTLMQEKETPKQDNPSKIKSAVPVEEGVPDIDSLSDSDDDKIGIPKTVPPGLEPMQAVKEVLAKPIADRKEYLKNCRDLGILRDLALFESDIKLNKQARKKVLKLETEMKIS